MSDLRELEGLADEIRAAEYFEWAARLRASISALRGPKLIGWRTDNYLMETADHAMAMNWESHYQILPIFEGDPNTKLIAHTEQPK